METLRSGVTLTAEDSSRINVNIGETAKHLVPGTPQTGQRGQLLVIAPYTEFLEKNYTNNKAPKIINVNTNTTSEVHH